MIRNNPIIQRYVQLSDDYSDFIKLKKSALNVFDWTDFCNLEYRLNGPWNALLKWNESPEHVYPLLLQSRDEVFSLFNQYRRREISHEQFSDMLLESREALEEYEETLKEHLSSDGEALVNFYEVAQAM